MRIFLAGHNGMVGSAILRKLEQENHSIIKADRKDLDLRRQSDVEKFFDENRPEQVIIAAAKVGGINANNKYRADFIYSNLQIQNNIIHTSHLYGVEKLLFLGSSCIYPKNAQQPIKEEYICQYRTSKKQKYPRH
jgi:GDP-L-fucose synthase